MLFEPITFVVSKAYVAVVCRHTLLWALGLIIQVVRAYVIVCCRRRYACLPLRNVEETCNLWFGLTSYRHSMTAITIDSIVITATNKRSSSDFHVHVHVSRVTISSKEITRSQDPLNCSIDPTRRHMQSASTSQNYTPTARRHFTLALEFYTANLVVTQSEQ